MPGEALRELYLDELKDLFNAENQLVSLLPDIARATTWEELKHSFQELLSQTRWHVLRLEEILKSWEESPKGRKCAGMEGLVMECDQVIGAGYQDAVRDAALVGAAQRIEHYEIAAYETVCQFAHVLGESTSLLQQTLREERKASAKLTELAKRIHSQANDEKNAEVARRKKRTERALRIA
jgi:ferritin-like metal-binding protein YciE